mmetsp:Transcript_27570/g.38490  ORF Transcript_27570/g.38490 Transcript_27570/m.38490 type:complete len:301 (+) Transcript_27570:19-921(+)
MQNQYGLHKFAVEKAMLMDYLDEKKSLDTIDKKTEFLKKCIQKYVEYDRMPPQAKSVNLFNASLQERKWYLWGSLGWKEYMQQRQMDIMKLRQEQQRSGIKRIPFQIPPGWTHELLPVKTTPENPAVREFLLLKIPNGLKPGTPYIYPFQRSKFGIRVRLPPSWSEEKTKNGGTQRFSMEGSPLPIMMRVPPTLLPGDVILQPKPELQSPQPKKASSGAGAQSFSGLKSGFLNKVGDKAAGKSSKKISKKSSSSSRQNSRQVVPGQWTWGTKDAIVLGGAAVLVGGLSYLFWKKNVCYIM